MHLKIQKKKKKFQRQTKDHTGESNNENTLQENYPQEKTRAVRSEALIECQQDKWKRCTFRHILMKCLQFKNKKEKYKLSERTGYLQTNEHEAGSGHG